MRVISLGIRTVPVLSVAKKLAAPRPTPTAPAAKCGLIKQDELKRTDYDCRLGAEKLLPCCSFLLFSK